MPTHSRLPLYQGEPVANQQRFRWDALNVTNATTVCGLDKCYFQGEREGEGWLVCWRSGRHHFQDRYLMQQSKAWAFAEELRVGFGVDHLMSGPLARGAAPGRKFV